MPSVQDPRLNVLPSASPSASSLPEFLPTPEPISSDQPTYTSLPPLGPNIKVLMVWPSFPPSFWGFEGVLQMIPERAMTPPLGLITVAALCPASWQIRLDRPRLRRVAGRGSAVGGPGDGERHARPACRRAGCSCPRSRLWPRTFVGGPWASTDPEAVLQVADHVMVGEAEEAFPGIAAALENGTRARALPHYR